MKQAIGPENDQIVVRSYLAFPKTGFFEELRDSIKEIKGCQVFPAREKELLVVLADAHSQGHSQQIEEQIQKIPSLQCLSLTFANVDANPPTNRAEL